MKTIALLTLLVAAIAAPTASALRMPTVGPRINLFAPPATFPADTPFHINHGWVCEPPGSIQDCLDSGTRFELLVDGVDVPAAHDLEYDPHATTSTEADVSNFRFGLPAGTHTFEGRWYLDGQLALDLTETITFS
jgi:hypothetical protein